MARGEVHQENVVIEINGIIHFVKIIKTFLMCKNLQNNNLTMNFSYNLCTKLK